MIVLDERGSIMDMKQIVKGVVLTKACSIKADKDSTESKTIHLSVKFDGVVLQDVFDKAVSGAVIQWQNGPGRSKYDSWKNGQGVTIEFKSPARTTIDPEVAMIAKLAEMSPEKQLEYLKSMMEKANK